MKFCPHCGKPLQFGHAEICPACGCRISGFSFRLDRITVVVLIAILAVLCIIAAGMFQFLPVSTARNSVVPAGTSSGDSSLSVAWNTMDDWEHWEHGGSWSGKTAGACSEYGPRIENGHGEFGTNVSLLAGSTESRVWRTFYDAAGNGWDTLTFTGRLSPCDMPQGRWMKIEVNDRVVYEADATGIPPGNGEVFTIPVHFPRSTTVKVKISNGQTPVWGTWFWMDFYSLRLSREGGGTS